MLQTITQLTDSCWQLSVISFHQSQAFLVEHQDLGLDFQDLLEEHQWSLEFRDKVARSGMTARRYRKQLVGTNFFRRIAAGMRTTEPGNFASRMGFFVNKVSRYTDVVVKTSF